MINFKDVEKDIQYRSYDKNHYGGQHLNSVSAGIIAIHLPTGLAVVCDGERSQFRNKAKATEELVYYLGRLGLIKCTCEN